MSEEDREKWDQRYASGEHVRSQAPGWLRDLDDELPAEGRALDVAAGTGRVSVWLARRGLDVTAIDVSPIGLALAREAAADEAVKIKTAVVDLEKDPLPEGPFDIVACFHYRQRGLWSSLKSALRPGGMIVAELPTVRTLERSTRPSARWLAETNELLRDLSGLTLIYYRERWAADRHVARLAARKELG
jgi:2-polyprenyl-3-methyl-5-hydroxy-6-metoxy-1,4-benzoquinol methylase